MYQTYVHVTTFIKLSIVDLFYNLVRHYKSQIPLKELNFARSLNYLSQFCSVRLPNNFYTNYCNDLESQDGILKIGSLFQASPCGTPTARQRI